MKTTESTTSNKKQKKGTPMGANSNTYTPKRYLTPQSDGTDTSNMPGANGAGETPKYLAVEDDGTTAPNMPGGKGGTQMLDASGNYQDIPGPASNTALVDTTSTVTRPGQNGAGTKPKPGADSSQYQSDEVETNPGTYATPSSQDFKNKVRGKIRKQMNR